MPKNTKESQIIISIREQQLKCKNVLCEQNEAINQLSELQKQNFDTLNETEDLIAQANSLLDSVENKLDLSCLSELSTLEENSSALDSIDYSGTGSTNRFEHLDTLEFSKDCNIDEFYTLQQQYAKEHNIDLNKNLSSYLSREEMESLDKLVKEELSYKGANCDKYDYMISGTIGVLSGIIDIIFVGTPADGILTKFSDDAVNGIVQRTAKMMGWKGPSDGKDPTKSAIGFLERLAPVNYDQATGADVGNQFQMSMKNHHLKSIGHWPDLIGLIFSIVNQFTNTSSFVSSGQIITIETNTFELQGSDFISKLFSGFSNWIFHLLSDVAGSSGAQGRGSGIPIPFYGLTQFINVGEFGQHRDTFATTCVRVFQEGYDFRHGTAMAIPVIFTELAIRLMYFIRSYFIKKMPFTESLPRERIPEVRRMLLVAHGTMCVIDATDAAIRSGGELVTFLLRTNIIAWCRFAQIALKEIIAGLRKGKINPEAVDSYLEEEYKKLLNN